MSKHKTRIEKLEQQTPAKTPRLIVLMDGLYRERGKVLTEAEYQAFTQDPANDVTLRKVVYSSEAVNT